MIVIGNQQREGSGVNLMPTLLQQVLAELEMRTIELEACRKRLVDRDRKAEELREKLMREEEALGAALNELERRNLETERARTAVALENRELRQVREFAQRAAVDERINIGREVHGETLNGIDRVVRELRSIEAPVQNEQLAGIKDELMRIRRETSRIVKKMHPDVLEANGFVPALASLAARCTKQDRIVCRFNNMVGDDDYEPKESYKKLEIYRIVQEAINNVVKHSRASNVEICIARNGKDLEVLVVDDGVGCDGELIACRKIERACEGGGQGCSDIENWAKLIDGQVFWQRRPLPETGTIFFLRLSD